MHLYNSVGGYKGLVFRTEELFVDETFDHRIIQGGTYLPPVWCLGFCKFGNLMTMRNDRNDVICVRVRGASQIQAKRGLIVDDKGIRSRHNLPPLCIVSSSGQNVSQCSVFSVTM